MKQFLSYFFTLILTALLLFFMLEHIADSGLRKSKNTMVSQWEGILEGTINSDMVVLGSSRGYVSYDCQILETITGEKTFNLSYNAGAYKVQQLKYDIYSKPNKKPKIIIQNVDLAHFSASSDLPDVYQFIPYTGHDGLISQLKKFNKDFNLNSGIPILKYNGNKVLFWRGIKGFLGIDTPKVQNVFSGFHPHERKYKKDFQNLLRLEKMSKEVDKEKFYREGLEDLKKIVRSNSNDSIKVVLVWAPEYKERYSTVESIVEPLKRELSEFAAKQDGVYFVDMSNDKISMSEANFYDTFHLNKNGATLFSTSLAHKIKNLNLNDD